jgi:hypothetical protein
MEPAQRIIQDMSPMEGEGPLQAVHFSDLQSGSYQVNAIQPLNMCPNLDFGCPSFEGFFGLFGERVNAAIETGGLPAETQALVVIEDWAKDLKKVTLRIVWQKPSEADATQMVDNSYVRVVYLHAAREGE